MESHFTRRQAATSDRRFIIGQYAGYALKTQAAEALADTNFPAVRVFLIKWVRDLEESLRFHNEEFGLGPWTIHEATAPLLRNVTFRGKQVEMGFREAMIDLGVLMLVLTQPLGASAEFAEWLASKGDNFSHLLLFLPDRASAEEAGARFSALGADVLFSSDLGETIRNIGLDTDSLLSLTLEISGGNPEEVFPVMGEVPPLAIYPPS